MGLDITAYRGLRKIAVENESEDDDVQLYINPEFRDQADGIDVESHYAAADSFGFHAGSYIWYGHWREMLAKLAQYEPANAGSANNEDDRRWIEQLPHSMGAWAYDDGPFVELICFSDCEGVIGPVTSAKLARDFAEFQPKADEHPDEHFRRKYADWRKAFEMASDGGAVSFH